MIPSPRSLALLLLGASLAHRADAQTLPNGVAAGDVQQHAAVLWARSTAIGELRFELSQDPDFQVGVETFLAHGCNPLLPVRQVVTALDADTIYFYRVTDPAQSVGKGRFRTPARQGSSTGVRFGVSGDSRGDNAPFHSLRGVPDHDLDLFVFLGDTIYADIESPILPGVPQARSMKEFRLKHSEVYSEVDGLNGLADVRAAMATLTTIDDHEVTNDFAGGAHPSSDDRFDDDVDFINETRLFSNGLRAFHEYNPIRGEKYGDVGDPRMNHKRRLYRKRYYGSDAVFLVLDARSFRDEGLVPADFNNPRDIFRFVCESFDPDRTMLGRTQVEELKADLSEAQARGTRWKVVVVPEPIQNLSVILAEDRFEGYAAERTELLRHIDEQGIENVLFIAADIHGSIVNDLAYQEFAGGPQIPTTAFEVTTGPIAFDAPFGPTVVEIAHEFGLISDREKRLYDSLPLAGKDAFVRDLIDNVLFIFGYNFLGLEDSNLDVQLLEGSYVSLHTYGWTEFDIAPKTQVLTVTTYGVLPDDVTSKPFVLGRFEVVPE